MTDKIISILGNSTEEILKKEVCKKLDNIEPKIFSYKFLDTIYRIDGIMVRAEYIN